MLRSVASALGELKDARAVQPLIDAAGSENTRMARFSYSFDSIPFNDPSYDPVAQPLRQFGLMAIEPLAKTLADKSKSSRVRTVAAAVLYDLAVQGNLDHDDLKPAVDSLFDALSDPEDNVRNYAALTLADLGDNRAAAALVEMIKKPNYGVTAFQNATAFLSQLHDSKGIELLIPLLKDERASVRADAAKAIGWMRDVRAVEPLLPLLKDNNSSVRAASALALGLLKAPAALRPLKALLEDEDESVALAAVEGLGRSGLTEAGDSLAKLAEMPVPPIDRSAADQNGNPNRAIDMRWRLHVAAAVALARLNDSRALKPIGECLQTTDVVDREYAATEISTSFLKNPDLVKSLTVALSDPSIRVRLYAAGGLGHIGNQAAANALLAKIDDRENLSSILTALIESKDTRVSKLLPKYLDDTDVSTRSSVAYGLGKLGGPDAVEPLAKHLNDSTSEVRLSIVKALSKIKSPEALAALKKATEDDDPEVRIRAAKGIKTIEQASTKPD